MAMLVQPLAMAISAIMAKMSIMAIRAMANGCTNMDITLNQGGRVILMNTKVKIEFFHAAIFVHMPYRRD